MLATGTDAAAGVQDIGPAYLRYADDAINMPCQASTQWDALAHIFLDDKMWNGYPAELVDAKGAKKNGIENYRDKMCRPRRAAGHRPLEGRGHAAAGLSDHQCRP
jgi:hypothetical protein